jgi:hypothetical protein
MTNSMNNLNDLAILNSESEAPNDGFAGPNNESTSKSCGRTW